MSRRRGQVFKTDKNEIALMYYDEQHTKTHKKRVTEKVKPNKKWQKIVVNNGWQI